MCALCHKRYTRIYIIMYTYRYIVFSYIYIEIERYPTKKTKLLRKFNVVKEFPAQLDKTIHGDNSCFYYIICI